MIEVEVSKCFEPFLPAAMLRLQAMFPEADIGINGTEISVVGSSWPSHEVRKAVLHIIYREKIYAETLPARTAFIQAVTSP